MNLIGASRSFVIAIVFFAFSQSFSVAAGEDFEATILLTADGTLDNMDPFSLMLPDPNKEGLREALGWGDGEIEEFRYDAELFFLDRFGFDFTGIEEGINGEKYLPGVGTLMFVRFAPETGYQVVYMNNRISGAPVDSMGYIVMITDQDVRYHGEFGGEEGVAAFPGEIAAYGVYKFGKRTPVAAGKSVVFFQQAIPGRFVPEGTIGIFCDIDSAKFGAGKGEGVVTMSPLEDGRTHVTIRNILVFPGRLN